MDNDYPKYFLVSKFFLVYQFGPVVGAQLGKPIYIFAPNAERYGKVAIEMIELNGYYANGEQWEETKEKLKNEFKKVSVYEDTYLFIEEALQVGGGKHSFLLTKENRQTLSAKDEMPSTTREGDLLIIKLPQHLDAAANGKQYADTVLQEIKNNMNIKGAIIDLRGNRGGDMGPMITAVSPFLEDGDLYHLEYLDRDWTVKLENGKSIGGGTQITTNITPFKLDVPVAVLIDDQTASSGEAVLMAFMGQPHAKTFGQPSAGYASANITLPLYDGTLINITVAYNKTLNGEVFYDTPVLPDVQTDHPLEQAIEWLTK
ncbi:S41 family peptidase [Metasolibacillus meyeri]|uniref:S41 family peptidase n=1 Tax=Metasolibacillus meyeri TaxID=1071052 RepID=A0AAW9NV00_9BACL|nr:S41 family peptidase [Metasolibacillus meyeri]MEC1178088.1 S41 family peptidase [Metasolibacillus meyeri]